MVHLQNNRNSNFPSSNKSQNIHSQLGHTDAVLCVSFNPQGTQLATGSGDKTVRIWDLDTQTPLHTLSGHTNWVLYVSWSPDGKKLISGGMDNDLRIWDPNTGKQMGKPLKGHKKYGNHKITPTFAVLLKKKIVYSSFPVTAVAWEPLHMNPYCVRMASASKDATVIVWDTRKCQMIYALSSHTMSVTCIRWGGQNLLFTGSQDRTIKVKIISLSNLRSR